MIFLLILYSQDQNAIKKLRFQPDFKTCVMNKYFKIHGFNKLPASLAFPTLCMLLGITIWISGGNQTLFLHINQLASVSGAGLWANLTLFGDTLVALTLLSPWIYRRPEILWSALLAGILCAFWVYTLKQGFNMPRPAAVLPADSFTIIGPSLRQGAFPSGHSATAWCMAGVLWCCVTSRWLRWVIVVLALGVGVSRIMVGAHWPVDVLGGMAVGSLCAIAGVGLARRWHWGSGDRGEPVVALFYMLCGTSLLFHQQTGYPQAEVLRVAIAIGGLSLGLRNINRFWRH